MFPEYLNQYHSPSTKKLRPQSTRSRPSNSKSSDPPSLAIPALPHTTSARHSLSATLPRVSFTGPHHVSPSFPAQSVTLPSSSGTELHSTRKCANSDSLCYSFDILRSDPSSPSLQHIASSATYPNRPVHPTIQDSRTCPSDGFMPAFHVAVSATSDAAQRSPDTHGPRGYPPSSSGKHAESVHMQIVGSRSGCSSFPAFGSATVRRTHAGDITDSDDDELSASNSGKRHVCPTCFKRFNRPSSLKIHVNTHTGATPFRCPWPDCGREFNVNSNMRRHYRNHTIPGSKAVDHRRRRRRIPGPGPMDDSVSHTIRRMPISSTDSPLISSRSASEESDEDINTPMDGCDRLLSAGAGASKLSKARFNRASRCYSQSHIRTWRFESPSCSASPSLSPSPPPDHVYTPSAPYVRSFMDRRVSTALRPVFHPAFSAPSGGCAIKEEP